MCVCEVGRERERERGQQHKALWGQWGVQCVRGLGATALWFHSPAAQRISFPVSQCWAHAGQVEPRQENLCWCQQWKHYHPFNTSHNICQTAVCPFFLSPSVILFFRSEYSHSYRCAFWKSQICAAGVSHLAWFVVSAPSLVTQIAIGLLRGWDSFFGGVICTCGSLRHWMWNVKTTKIKWQKFIQLALLPPPASGSPSKYASNGE